MNSDQIIIRDSIVFAVALVFISGGLAHAIQLLMGLSWWTAASIGAGLWAGAATLLYRRVQGQLAGPPAEQVA